MSIVLHGSFEPVRVTWSWERRAVGRELDLDDRTAAKAWLRAAVQTAGEMARVRRLVDERAVVPGYGLDDDEVLTRVADWIATGELRLAPLGREPLASWGDEGEEEPAPARPAGPAARVEEQEAPAEERTFGEDANPEAIAAVMREAADAGVPFCEECKRKQLRAERGVAEGAQA